MGNSSKGANMAYVEATDIQEILDSLGIRAAELARRTYVSRSYLSHLLSGRKSNPSALWALQVVRFCREEGPVRDPCSAGTRRAVRD